MNVPPGDKSYFVHPLADVSSSDIGRGTRVWQYSVVMEGARIGAYVNLGSHCFVETNARVGHRVTVKNGVFLWDGIELEDDVFVGPNVTFTNDPLPSSRDPRFVPLSTVVRQGASIGAGAVILPGVVIGKASFVAAASVVTRDVPNFAVVMGSPATIRGDVRQKYPEWVAPFEQTGATDAYRAEE